MKRLGRSPARRVAGAALAVGLLLVRPSAAQEAVPLLKADLIRLLVATDYTADEISEIIRANCVGFVPSRRDREDIAALPGGDAVLKEVDRCGRAGKSNGYHRGIPHTSPVPVGDSAPPDAAVSSENPVHASTRPAGPPPLPSPPPPKSVPLDDVVLGPVQIPPRLLNGRHVSDRLLREYRPAIRRPGTVVLRLYIDADGHVTESAVRESSEDPRLDRAALRTVASMRFAPATMRDRPVGSWTDVPIRFETP